MHFQTPLIPAKLIRRYKRFLADIILEDGSEVTAHCPNPGSMLGLCEAGSSIWVEPNSNPRKKLNFGWRLVDNENGGFIGIDTSAANKIIQEALFDRQITGLEIYDSFRSEVKYGTGSRVDFLLSKMGHKDTYLEIKSVTLMREQGIAEFPDSPTARGLKHLHELAKVVELGHRAVMLFLVQRSDCKEFQIARDIDPAYAEGFYYALKKGVKILCLSCKLSPYTIDVDKEVPFKI